jgi:hypothetical protein
MGNSAPKGVVRQSLSFCCWHVHGFSYVATVSSLGPLSGDRLVRRPADSSPGWRRARMAVFRARDSCGWTCASPVASASRSSPPSPHGQLRPGYLLDMRPASPAVRQVLGITGWPGPLAQFVSHSRSQRSTGDRRPPVRAGQGRWRPVMDGSQTGQAAGVGLTVAGCPLPCLAAKRGVVSDRDAALRRHDELPMGRSAIPILESCAQTVYIVTAAGTAVAASAIAA